MSQTPEFANLYAPDPDRRMHSRQQVRALAYVKLGEGNGGIVLDMSEGGMSARAVTSLVEESLPCIRFQLSPSQGWIESAARVVWASDSKTVVGLEFTGLSPQDSGRIREWLAREIIPKKIPRRPETASPQRTSPATAPVASESKLSEIRPAKPQAAAAALQSVLETSVAAPPPSRKLALMLDHTQALKPERPGSASRMQTLAMNLVPGTWMLIFLAALLATASLLAGWVEGRRNGNPALRKAPEIARQDSAAIQSATPPAAGTVARVSQIVVVDTGNQPWTIPWVGPPSAPVRDQRAAQPPDMPQPSRKALPRFQTWVLSPPRPAQQAASGAPMERQSPPIPIDVSGNSEGQARPSALTEIPIVAPPAVAEPKQAASVLREGKLIHRVEPVYPALAKGQRIEGTVNLRATIGPDGLVRSVEVLGGPAPLVPAATQAVRQWRYSPTLLNGVPSGTTKDINIVFSLSSSN